MLQTAKQWPARIVALVAALCLAMAMVPATAFAANAQTGTLTLKATTASVASGGALSIPDVALYDEVADGQSSISVNPSDGDYHLDYVASDNAPFTVNKHAGGLLANTVTGADQTGTVTVYLLAGSQPAGNNGKPCNGYTILDQKDVTVTVRAGASPTYDYQGTGFQIKLTSPTVTNTSSSTTSGLTTYTNTVSSQTAGNTVSFTYYQNAGLNQYLNFYNSWEDANGNTVAYNSPEEAYQALAGQYITYTDADGTTYLSDTSQTFMEVTSVTSTSVTISVELGDAGTGTLSFLPGLHTFRQNKIAQVNKLLGVNVDFTFAVV